MSKPLCCAGCDELIENQDPVYCAEDYDLAVKQRNEEATEARRLLAERDEAVTYQKALMESQERLAAEVVEWRQRADAWRANFTEAERVAGQTADWLAKAEKERTAATESYNGMMLQASKMETEKNTLGGAALAYEALLRELVAEAHAAEDAGDFVLWVQEKLEAWRLS